MIVYVREKILTEKCNKLKSLLSKYCNSYRTSKGLYFHCHFEYFFNDFCVKVIEWTYFMYYEDIISSTES